MRTTVLDFFNCNGHLQKRYFIVFQTFYPVLSELTSATRNKQQATRRIAFNLLVRVRRERARAVRVPVLGSTHSTH